MTVSTTSTRSSGFSALRVWRDATALFPLTAQHHHPWAYSYPEDSTTTTLPILILTPASCWARRQLHTGVGFIPT